MKQSIKSIIISALQWEAGKILKKYQPKIIAITGSVGKTSTKDAIFSALADSFYVRKSEKSFNSQIGVPLTILGCQNGWNNPFIWLQNLIKGFILIVAKSHYPEWLVLEVGADGPGGIKKMSEWLKPDILVITRFGKTPVHIEFFESVEELIEEDGALIDSLKRRGVLILNSDDEDVRAFKNKSSNKTITYGTEGGSDVFASNYRVLYGIDKKGKFPTGIQFKVEWSGNSAPVVLMGVLGAHHIYPALAAAAVGISQGLNIVQISKSLRSHASPLGRMKIIKGIKNSIVIDDSYNSSPVALEEALKTLQMIEGARRKIAVLGDMLELGEHSVSAHKEAGAIASRSCHLLAVVGPRSRDIAEGALQNGMREKDVLQFETSEEAGAYLENFISEKDVVLVKGSQSMRMEKVVEEIMDNPEAKEKLLVRQEKEWEER
ncbi:MAG: UDP-N-acetylmuramoyl-tripeptide-D-alanyl-D-alanine ligase [Parcubacteria group bacterium GW2011_GWA1_40_21]|nr:MAG: UDP-N-acetylmuramoyl-tripeptide-D-alanyl-D-alanine ligase [Parcubacteria group bacterium GW2011_GWC1_40_13]KKR53133.1 MAG: UDP-N-acetylmuramoyl-tripeptide-D-alanyl-D-alanine ligase [Parcubacteria group bacterium GW2011_GWA1_40_21]